MKYDKDDCGEKKKKIAKKMKMQEFGPQDKFSSKDVSKEKQGWKEKAHKSDEE